jgi:hypothetical protein
MYISIEQAVGIYDELFKACIGRNRYGGDTAEIYTYRLLPYDGIYSRNWMDAKPGDPFWEDYLLLEHKAARSLVDIIDMFRTHNECEVTVEDDTGFIDYTVWVENVLKNKYRFAHRIHVRVVRKDGA